MEAIKKQATKLREQVAKQQQVSFLSTLLIYAVMYLFFFFKYLVGEVTIYQVFFFVLRDKLFIWIKIPFLLILLHLVVSFCNLIIGV